MPDPFDACLAFTLAQEGGFCDNPDDPGGATCHGITLAVLRGWTADDTLGPAAIRGIDAGTVQAIYAADYWNRLRCDALPRGVDLMVFDQGVNAGPPCSARILQRALRFSISDVDGSIGPQTLAAARATGARPLIVTLAKIQDAHYRGLVGFDRFGAGWLARLGRRSQAALAVAPPAREALSA